MNPELTGELTRRAARDLRYAAERHNRHAEHGQPPAGTSAPRPSALRRRIGFTLVEAGLALLAGPADWPARAGR
jgi:hypothetical protein